MRSLADFRLEGGVYVPSVDGPSDEDDYRSQWEREARDDPVRFATARPMGLRHDYASLTTKIGPFWRRFPEGRHFDSILELGCGYGRLPLYLGRERGLTGDRYLGIDVSETMLRHFLENRATFGVLPGAELELVCTSAHALPVPDASVDLVLSSAVFLHMGKRYVRAALAEVARVLAPAGRFAFESSFPNRFCPANFPAELRGLVPWRRKAHYLKYYSLRELRSLLAGAGLARRAWRCSIEASSYGLLPKRIGTVPVPLARRLNDSIRSVPPRFEGVVATSFDVSSQPL